MGPLDMNWAINIHVVSELTYIKHDIGSIRIGVGPLTPRPARPGTEYGPSHT